MGKQRIMLICLTGLLIFCLLLGGKIIYEKNWQEGPMLRESQQIQGVVSATIEKVKGEKELNVVTDQVVSLRQTCRALQKLESDIPIRFLDQSTDELEKVLGEMQFALQEGLALGEFTLMEQKIQAQAEEAGVQCTLEIDNEAVYVALNQGEAQLLEVIERHEQVKFLPTEKQTN